MLPEFGVSSRGGRKARSGRWFDEFDEVLRGGAARLRRLR